MEISFHDLLIIYLVVIPAALLHGLIGFGFGLLVIPFVTIFFRIWEMVPLITLLGFVINFHLLLKLDERPKSPDYYYLIFGTVLGFTPGIFFLKTADPVLLKIMISIVLILYSSYSLFVRQIVVSTPPVVGLFAGFAGSFLGTSIAASGPPIVIYTTIQPWLKKQIRATNTLYLFITGIFSVFSHIFVKATTFKTLTAFALIAPICLLCSWIGSKYVDKVDKDFFTKVAFVVLLIAGVTSLLSKIIQSYQS